MHDKIGTENEIRIEIVEDVKLPEATKTLESLEEEIIKTSKCLA